MTCELVCKMKHSVAFARKVVFVLVALVSVSTSQRTNAKQNSGAREAPTVNIPDQGTVMGKEVRFHLLHEGLWLRSVKTLWRFIRLLFLTPFPTSIFYGQNSVDSFYFVQIFLVLLLWMRKLIWKRWLILLFCFFCWVVFGGLKMEIRLLLKFSLGNKKWKKGIVNGRICLSIVCNQCSITCRISKIMLRNCGSSIERIANCFWSCRVCYKVLRCEANDKTCIHFGNFEFKQIITFLEVLITQKYCWIKIFEQVNK